MEEFLNYLKEVVGKNGDFRYEVDGKPMLEIKNGEVVTDNISKPKEKTCKVENTCPQAPAEEPDEDEPIRITKDVYRDPFEERYYIREKAGNQPLTLERVISFDTRNEDDTISPGVSDLDLAFILLYRNRDDIRKYNAIMDFIKANQ